MNKIFHVASVFIILMAVITSSFGLFFTTDGQSFDFINQYGDTIKIYGDGIYKNDSYFMAPIFKGIGNNDESENRMMIKLPG
jgi:hypothetical protein